MVMMGMMGMMKMRMITTRRKDAAVVETVTSISIFNEASIPHESDFIIGDVEEEEAAAAAETVAVLAGEATSFSDGAAFACCRRGVVHDDGSAETEAVEGTAGIFLSLSSSSPIDPFNKSQNTSNFSAVDPINKNHNTKNFSALSTVSNFKTNVGLRRLPRVVVDDVLK